MNKKLSYPDRSVMRHVARVDIGVAVDNDGQLRTAVVRDVSGKTSHEVYTDLLRFQQEGYRFTKEDTDLDNVCWTLTSIGKMA